ncbi:MAG: excinuclease ABC subunit UvrA [Planctomycetota bacterium]
MAPCDIVIRGARQHNLKGIDLELPSRSLITLTGVSGSGKSSLALDTIFKEGERRFLRSLSPEARRLLGTLQRPQVERLEGLSPALAIEPRAGAPHPRSTVGTVSEIHDALRLLYARLGVAHCVGCRRELRSQTVDQVVERVLAGHAGRPCLVLAPIVRRERKLPRHELEHFRLGGFVRIRVDGSVARLDDLPSLDWGRGHALEIVVDRLTLEASKRGRLAEAVEMATGITRGTVGFLCDGDAQVHWQSLRLHCPPCDRSFPDLGPRLFSFSSRHGACRSCEGLGAGADGQECPACRGARLGPEALSVTLGGVGLADLLTRPLPGVEAFFRALELPETDRCRSEPLVRSCLERLRFLAEVGLGYLTLGRSAATLSGGELQRVRLAARLGSGLEGVLYVLDEPSVGLHAEDNDRLIRTLHRLRDQGNTVLVVEHDRDTMLASDYLVDLGPGAGERGGEVVARGTPAEVAGHPTSLTARFLRGEPLGPGWRARPPRAGPEIVVIGASQFNLKGIDVAIPLQRLVAITGVSGSGKSTLVHEILRKGLDRLLHGAPGTPGAHREIRGSEHLARVVEIDQRPLGRTARSNPATSTKLFDLVRELFAKTPEARMRGYPKSRFSFNVPGGRCEACKGSGVRPLDVPVLGRIEVPCRACGGARYDSELLDVRLKGLTIREVLDLSVDEAREFFKAVPRLRHLLDVLRQVGLGYLRLGQPATSLSGGESQRVKLAAELGRLSEAPTLYLLDEPTTGLHAADIACLLQVLQGLVERGHTVLVIEHNLEVVRACDWVIDLGPGAGDAGGRVVACGPPGTLITCPESATGRALARQAAPRPSAGPDSPARRAPARNDLVVRGARKNNLKHVDVTLPNDRITAITGVSGAGKSSLAVDTLFAEGQRRFVESLSSYARRFLSIMERPPADSIEGLRPSILMERRAPRRSRRTLVATVTEIYDLLRALWARGGETYCPFCGRRMHGDPPSIAAARLTRALSGARAHVLSPLFDARLPRHFARARLGRESDLWNELLRQGYVRVLIDGVEQRLDGASFTVSDRISHLDLVVDRLVINAANQRRLAEALEQALDRASGLAALLVNGERHDLSVRLGCVPCGFFTERPLSAGTFSFNSREGACHVCDGLGEAVFPDPDMVLGDVRKPLFDGALRAFPGFDPRDDRQPWGSAAGVVAQELGADLTQPFAQWGERARRALLWGEGLREAVSAQLAGGSGQWRGLLGELVRYLRSPGGEPAGLSFLRPGPCGACRGARLNPVARSVKVAGAALAELMGWSAARALEFVCRVERDASLAACARGLTDELRSRLESLVRLGLAPISLDRAVASLSAGEWSRLQLASLVADRLSGVLYVVDEPTVGMHAQDVAQLIEVLRELRDRGNTVLVVEHDAQVIRAADHVVDLGPGSGAEGGTVVAAGTPQQILEEPRSATGAYLSGTRAVGRRVPRCAAERWLRLEGVRWGPFADLSVAIPCGCLTVVTGPSAAGKTMLVMRVLRDALEAVLGREPRASRFSGRVRGARQIDRVVAVDQAPLGGSATAIVLSALGVFGVVRELFAATPEARLRGFDARRFLLSKPGGRCAACQGRGVVALDRLVFPDVVAPCDACGGRRYGLETLKVTHRGRSLADVLEMTVEEASEFFKREPRLREALRSVGRVGLDYLQAGRLLSTLSGGEAQRLRLARDLAFPRTGNCLYLLDEPTVGLHGADVAGLVGRLQELLERGHTVVVIEHHVDLIRNADHVIDLAPGEGRVWVGSPDDLAGVDSATGRLLREALGLIPAAPFPPEQDDHGQH